MLGAGFILLAEVAARLLIPQFKRHIGGTLILAAVFIGSGLGNFFGWDLVWPLILIAAGASVLLSGFLRTRS
jgi:low affinity Fe/Cu permease